MKDLYISPLLENNDFYLPFKCCGEVFIMTYNKATDCSSEEYTLLNNQSQRLDKMDYEYEFKMGSILVADTMKKEVA